MRGSPKWKVAGVFLLGLAAAQGGASPTTSGSLNDLAGLRSVLNAPGELHLVVIGRASCRERV